MNKTIILPLIALVCTVVKQTFHIEIGDALQNQLADAILAGSMLYGIIVNHIKHKGDVTDGKEK